MDDIRQLQLRNSQI